MQLVWKSYTNIFKWRSLEFLKVFAFNFSNLGMLLLLSIPGAALNPLFQDLNLFLRVIKSWLLINAELSGHIYLFSPS